MAEVALRKSGTEAGNAGMPIHMADIGSDNFEQEFTLSLMETEEDTLGRIEAALERIDEGNFGRCVQCDGADPQGAAQRDSLHARLHQVRRGAGKRPLAARPCNRRRRPCRRRGRSMLGVPRSRYALFAAIAAVGFGRRSGDQGLDLFLARAPRRETCTGCGRGTPDSNSVGTKARWAAWGRGTPGCSPTLSIVAGCAIPLWLFYWGAARDLWLTAGARIRNGWTLGESLRSARAPRSSLAGTRHRRRPARACGARLDSRPVERPIAVAEFQHRRFVVGGRRGGLGAARDADADLGGRQLPMWRATSTR